MSEQQLRAAIQEIRAELAHAEGLSDDTRQALRRLAGELEGRLKQWSGTSTESLRTELGDWVRELEVSHPTLSTALGRVIDTLAFFNL
jgi:outer membrane protein TolC